MSSVSCNLHASPHWMCSSKHARGNTDCSLFRRRAKVTTVCVAMMCALHHKGYHDIGYTAAIASVNNAKFAVLFVFSNMSTSKSSESGGWGGDSGAGGSSGGGGGDGDGGGGGGGDGGGGGVSGGAGGDGGRGGAEGGDGGSGNGGGGESG